MASKEITAEINALTLACRYIQRRASAEKDRDLHACALTMYQLIQDLRQINMLFVSAGGRV